MKIVNRKEFLSMPKYTVYMKKFDDICGFGDIEVKTSAPEDQWGNDFVVDYMCVFMKEPFNDVMAFPELGDEFRFEENQNTRDGLFENEQLFAVFDNEDIQQVIDKLKRCLK